MARHRFVSSGNSKYIEKPVCEPETPEPIYRDLVLSTGLSWVEFHALSNSIFDLLDPKFGKGLKYTYEEIESNCEARMILARELASLNNRRRLPISDQAIIRANKSGQARVLKFNETRTSRNSERSERSERNTRPLPPGPFKAS